MEDVEFKYVKINNNSYIFFKIGGQDGRRKFESDVSQLCVSDTKRNEVSIHMK